MDTVVEFGDLGKVIGLLKSRKVLAGGCFDLLHIGHTRFLKAARKHGDILIIALESDEFIQHRKKRKPFYPQKERAEILTSLKTVDSVILLPFFKSYDEYLQLVRLVGPAVVAVTQGDPYLADKERQMKTIGGTVAVVIERINGYNSSETIKKTTT